VFLKIINVSIHIDTKISETLPIQIFCRFFSKPAALSRSLLISLTASWHKSASPHLISFAPDEYCCCYRA